MKVKEKADLIARIQAALRARETPAWLFYGFRDLDPTAYNILQFPANPHVSRRWFYLVPAQGEPRKLVHRIEHWQLDHLPGKKEVYLRWEELQAGLTAILRGVSRVAMQYSEKNAIPYISRVDAGTVEWVRSLGVEVVSSGDLVQIFEAVLSPAQLDQHRDTAQRLTAIVQEAFQTAAETISQRGRTDEMAVQQFVLNSFSEVGLVYDYPPIVAVNAHSGDPHYSPTPRSNTAIGKGDFLLIDLWAKTKQDHAVYADITWTGFFGAAPTDRHRQVFEAVRQGRDSAAQLLTDRLAAGRRVEGWEVDDAAREVIREAGFGEFFVHRTGHNLGEEVHGNGVNFDNLETHDTRQVIPGIACTIEPGVYLDDFGVRSEINVAALDGGLEITTPPQTELLVLSV